MIMINVDTEADAYDDNNDGNNDDNKLLFYACHAIIVFLTFCKCKNWSESE